MGRGVLVGLGVDVAVGVPVAVGVRVVVGVGVGVALGVGEDVAVGVSVGAEVGLVVTVGGGALVVACVGVTVVIGVSERVAVGEVSGASATEVAIGAAPQAVNSRTLRISRMPTVHKARFFILLSAKMQVFSAQSDSLVLNLHGLDTRLISRCRSPDRHDKALPGSDPFRTCPSERILSIWFQPYNAPC